MWGGYCTLPCTGASGCPTATSACIAIDPRYGETDAICWDKCASGDPCRQPGYQCYSVGAYSACWISPLPGQDAGQPADRVGQPCANDTQCKNPPAIGGVCLQRDLDRAWPGGYCSKSFCSTNAECGADAGSLCIIFDVNEGTEQRCVQRCGFDGGTSCRAGYGCEAYVLAQPDGGELPAPDGICLPPIAPPPQRTGQACTTQLDCLVPSSTIADCLPGTLPDGGPTPFPGGYCSRLGCGSDEECAPDAGGICLGISASESACFQSCPSSDAGQGPCRTGYVCTAYMVADGGHSPDGYCGAP
jgi:hypothetical protein